VKVYLINLKKEHKQKSFSLLELIFTIVLVGIITTYFIPKNNFSNLQQASNKIILYLKYTRYIAMIDNKFNTQDDMWFKERWTLKFQNCSKKVGGLYYVIFSDINHRGSPNKKTECLKDPVSNKYLYSNYDCEASYDESKYILLTKEYGITNVDISCNSTSTIGQISFGNDGKVYSRLGTNPGDINKYEIKETCFIKLYDKNENQITIAIEPETGFIYKL
jgi:type II secretory pathway pseudopilin PulG